MSHGGLTGHWQEGLQSYNIKLRANRTNPAVHCAPSPATQPVADNCAGHPKIPNLPAESPDNKTCNLRLVQSDHHHYVLNVYV